MRLRPCGCLFIPEDQVGKEPTSNAVLEDFPAELQGQAAAALETERLSVEKGIDA